MITVITGAPGAGKGTQADLLAEHRGFRKVSTGDALRKHVREGTEIGKVAGGLMEQGNLVPDDVLFEILKQELGENSEEKVLLDGYPRNVAQAKTLQTLESIHPVEHVIHIDVPEAELLERICGRRTCEKCGKAYHLRYDPPPQNGYCENCGGALVQRPDDFPEKVKRRLEVYEQQTKPILDFYKDQGLYRRVDGQGTQTEVFDRIVKIIDEQGVNKN